MKSIGERLKGYLSDISDEDRKRARGSVNPNLGYDSRPFPNLKKKKKQDGRS